MALKGVLTVMNSTLRDMLVSSGIDKDPVKMGAIHNSIEKYAEYFKNGQCHGPLSLGYEYYRLIDAEFEKKPPSGATCKKGCSFCCHVNTTINAVEGVVIADYCEKHDIPISKDILEEQLKWPSEEVFLSENSACVFLKDNLCSIYEVRPAECRKYFVATPAALCDTKGYNKQLVPVAFMRSLFVEIIVSAMDSVLLESGRMPEVLLPYAH